MLMGSQVGDTFQFATVRGVLTGGLQSAGALTFWKNKKSATLQDVPSSKDVQPWMMISMMILTKFEYQGQCTLVASSKPAQL
jgi:hypothetical protein